MNQNHQLRTHCVSVRLAPLELAELDAARCHRQRGAFLRDCWLRRPVSPVVPSLNRAAWAELSHAAANLNQLARRANTDDIPGFEELAEALAAFRASLLGARM